MVRLMTNQPNDSEVRPSEARGKVSASADRQTSAKQRHKSRKSNAGYFFGILVLISISALGIEIFLHEYDGLQQSHVTDSSRIAKDTDILDGAGSLNIVSEQHNTKNRKNQRKEQPAKEKYEVDLADLTGGNIDSAASSKKSKPKTNVQLYAEDEPSRMDMIKILETAGAKVDDDLRSKLPPVKDVENLYGRGVKIVGLERCEEFRTSIPADLADIGGAGMFNTGTNLLYILLNRNCHLPTRSKKSLQRNGIRWQVPWGKHPPVTWRFRNQASTDRKRIANHTVTLPVATIKDPLNWMGSMCRNSYAANWRHKPEHCPNLVPNQLDRKMGAKGDTVKVNVRYNSTHITHHKSLVNLWNEWYRGYYDATFPRLIVRSEDMMYHTEEVITKICTCGGGIMRDDFKYVLDSAKSGPGHKADANGLVGAMVKYGNSTLRIKGMTKEDLTFAEKELDPELMEAFGYLMP